jgi:hypothetical protein
MRGKIDPKSTTMIGETFSGCRFGIQKLTLRATVLALFIFILTNPLDTHAQIWSLVNSKEKLTQIFSNDRWMIPLGVGLAKTSIIGGRPWKFQLQYWNYVESADAFSSEHQIRLSINPVVSAPWNDDR